MSPSFFVRAGLVFLLAQIAFTPFVIVALFRRTHWRDNASAIWLSLGFLAMSSYLTAVILRYLRINP